MTAAPFHRILVGWDASPAAHTALATAMSIADADGNAVLNPPEHTETASEQNRDLDAQRRRPQEQFDDTLRTSATHGARGRLEWVQSTDIPDDLTACARHHGCDLVIVGRQGADSRLRTTGLGPVANALTQHTQFSVLMGQPTRCRRQPGHDLTVPGRGPLLLFPAGLPDPAANR